MPLPPKVSLRHGAYHYDLGRDEAGKRRSKMLCRVDDGEAALYKAIADLLKPRGRTLGEIFWSFMAKGMRDLAPRTQKDYRKYLQGPLEMVFCETHPDDVDDTHVAQYLSRRADQGAPVVANREIACLSSVYNFAMRRGLARRNPCRGVARNREKPRNRYVRDQEFVKPFEEAPPAFQDLMAALYLTGLRQGDIRSLRKAQLSASGIQIHESKRGKLRFIEWSDALRYFVTRAASRTPESPFVFTNSQGSPWTSDGIQSAVRRLKAKCGHDWTLHDLRAKAESDHKEGIGLLPLYKRAIRTKPVH
jgi:integrase